LAQDSAILQSYARDRLEKRTKNDADAAKLNSLIESWVFLREASIGVVNDPGRAEAMHLVASDQSALSAIREIAAEDGSRYLLDMILSRKPYRPIFDLSSTDWFVQSDRESVGAVVSSLRNLAGKPASAAENLETLRVKLQAELTSLDLIREIPSVTPMGSRALVNQVKILVDVPEDRGKQSLLLVAGTSSGYEREADLGTIYSGSEKGWAESTQPRVYLHPSFHMDFNEQTPQEMLRCLKSSLRLS
jgi:hypothetical protein